MSADVTALAKAALTGELGQLRDAVHKTAGPLTEEEFWRRPVEPGNSFGHLVLHLTGNLNYMVGACLGRTERASRECSATAVSRSRSTRRAAPIRNRRTPATSCTW